MKKLTFFAAVVFAIASMISCTKDHTCTCTTTSGSYTSTSVITYTKCKKGDAAKNCVTTSGTVTSGGTGYPYTQTCTLN